MSIGLFTDRIHEPSAREIAAAIGSSLEQWKDTAKWIRETYSTMDTLKFMYGKKYGWALSFRIRGKLATALYPTKDGFTAQLILNHATLNKAQQISLGKNAHDAIAKAHSYTEGKWLFIPVMSERDMEDFKQLLMLKLDPKGAQSSRAASVR